MRTDRTTSCNPRKQAPHASGFNPSSHTLRRPLTACPCLNPHASLYSGTMTPLRLPHLYRGWWIVFTGYLAQLLNGGASGWVFGVLILPMQHDLDWSRSSIVGVLTLQRLVDGAFGIWLGPQLDKHGARLVMTVCALF